MTKNTIVPEFSLYWPLEAVQRYNSIKYQKKKKNTGNTIIVTRGWMHSAAAMKMTGESSEMTMDDVKNLVKKKDEIEEQIKAYYDVLEDVSSLKHIMTFTGQN